ncbi:MAG: hypothetical protein ACE5FJ_10495, partial [Gemmatimonadales bacterium]
MCQQHSEIVSITAVPRLTDGERTFHTPAADFIGGVVATTSGGLRVLKLDLVLITHSRNLLALQWDPRSDEFDAGVTKTGCIDVRIHYVRLSISAYGS